MRRSRLQDRGQAIVVRIGIVRQDASRRDRQVSDIVGFETRASPERALDRALALLGAHRYDGVLEGELRDGAGFAQFLQPLAGHGHHHRVHADTG